VGDLIEFIKGKKPPVAKDFQDEGTLPIILIESFNSGSSTFAQPDKMIQCDFDDILMVMDGASSGRVETGYAGLVGSTIAKLEPKQTSVGRRYLYYFLKNIEPEMRVHLTGTSIPHVDKDWIKEQLVSIPNMTQILDRFEDISDRIQNLILTNQIQSRTLAAIRDALLPKLISGEIRVKDAERFLKERGL